MRSEISFYTGHSQHSSQQKTQARNFSATPRNNIAMTNDDTPGFDESTVQCK
jgi:hypothetical protein